MKINYRKILFYVLCIALGVVCYMKFIDAKNLLTQDYVVEALLSMFLMNIAIDSLYTGEIHIREVVIKRNEDGRVYWIAINIVLLGSIAWFIAMINDIRR